MNFIVSPFKTFGFFVLTAVIFFACTKITNTTLGSGLIPPVDGVTTKDTILEIQTKNAGIDTAYVGVSDNHVLGYTADPLFGKTTASINFQVSSPTYPLTLGAALNSVFLDSVVLSLSYKGVWGDSISPLALHVYQMDNENQFTSDSLYRTNKIFEKGVELTQSNTAAIVFPYLLNDPDTIKQFSEIADNTIRIRLNNSFGQQLFNQTETGTYTSDSTFHNFLRGIIVEADQTGNSLLQVNLTDTSTRLSLYYHFNDTATAGKTDTASRRFSVNSSTSASSNTILHNYSGAQIAGYYPSNSSLQDSLLYIQTNPGTYANLKIQGLTGLSNIIIHRAEILMSQVPDIGGADNKFTSPNLFVSAYSQDSMARFAIPYDVDFTSGVISNLSSFGVAPHSKTDNFTGSTISTYSFDISRYVQGIVTRKDTSYNLVVWAPYNYYLRPVLSSIYTYPISSPALNSVGIGRVRLGGGNNTNYRMRLHIVYSPVQ